MTAYDDETIREALVREHRRGGQSFVVCPRIEDIAPLRDRIAKLVPDLDIAVAHGELKAAEMDETMVRFADGTGDVLLATAIIESGLDVPRANTMLVWDAARFGLAQLHQLRGRVGRGQRRGVVYLLGDPKAPPIPPPSSACAPWRPWTASARASPSAPGILICAGPAIWWGRIRRATPSSLGSASTATCSNSR
ncbi:helicase-related protein [Methylobacterium persicinum]